VYGGSVHGLKSGSFVVKHSLISVYCNCTNVTSHGELVTVFCLACTSSPQAADRCSVELIN
jgi:hypothetical protein